MKIKIVTDKGEMEFVCEKAKVADGFLQITAPEDHKEVLIAIPQIKMIVVD